ncbi:PQQ-dependent sugar dehydrogenase [Ferruginibacter sp.]
MPKHLLLVLVAMITSICSSYTQPILTYTSVISSGLSTPVDAVPANDGTNRIFIAEQGGTIKVYSNTYTLLNSNFLTLSGNFISGGEQGLLSLAFHPDYENNRYFFVYYTNAAGGINIDRFQTMSSNANQADAATRTNIMTIDKPVAFTNHNGGKLNFGPDGNLYFGLGDSGSGGDPRNFAQRGDSLWGKMVRINVDNFTTPPYYTIPPDNPYVGSGTIMNEIFSFGLRNPWRWSFDKLNGNLWISDVGQDAREEVNVLTAAQANGANYGWRCYEGLQPYNTSGCLPASSYISPIFDYPHNNTTGGYAVTGGYVYRGSLFPAMYGYYICADYITGNAWVINATSNAATQQPTQLLNVSGFGELENGEIVVLTRTGTLYEVRTSSVLPLKLLQWDGFPYENYNQLTWQTASEIDVKQFEVEYSTDGISFKTAGTVIAKNNQHAAYSYRHFIQNSFLYYRLKIVNNNGRVEYSNTIYLKNNTLTDRQLVYYYSGSSRIIWLNIPPDEKAVFQLYNLSGQNVLNISSYLNNDIIDLQRLPGGLYVAKIILPGRTVTEKILVK